MVKKIEVSLHYPRLMIFPDRHNCLSLNQAELSDWRCNDCKALSSSNVWFEKIFLHRKPRRMCLHEYCCAARKRSRFWLSWRVLNMLQTYEIDVMLRWFDNSYLFLLEYFFWSRKIVPNAVKMTYPRQMQFRFDCSTKDIVLNQQWQLIFCPSCHSSIFSFGLCWTLWIVSSIYQSKTAA